MNIEQSGTTDTLPQSVATPISTPGTMRAIVQERYGETDGLRLERTGRPEIAADEVLIRVGFGFRGPRNRVRRHSLTVQLP